MGAVQTNEEQKNPLIDMLIPLAEDLIEIGKAGSRSFSWMYSTYQFREELAEKVQFIFQQYVFIVRFAQN